MKKYIILISAILFLTPESFAQNFAPFNAGVTKRFYSVNSPTDNDYFFYAESADTNATTVTFYQYHSLQQFIQPVNADSCPFWGGGGLTGIDTTWLGNTMQYDTSSRHLLLWNENLDTLDFDFSLVLGDSALFYQDGSNKFFIKLIQEQSEIIVSISDQVKTFRILHLDQFNVPVASPLHNVEIKLSEDHGLVSFIDAFGFPLVETPVALQGQLNPLIGVYQLTYDELYPYDIGDTLQYSRQISSMYYACYYIDKYTVVNRVETVDSVFIDFDWAYQWIHEDPPCPPAFPIFTQLNFKKNTDLFGFPYNRVNPNEWMHLNKSEGSYYLCDSALAYSNTELPETYCEDCGCYGGLDGFGYTFIDTRYAKGIGITGVYGMTYGLPQITDNYFLTYYNVNGTECGTFQAIGIEDEELQQLVVFPNPTSDYIQFNLVPDQVTVFDLRGELVLSLVSPGNSMDVTFLRSGVYFVKFEKDGASKYLKVIKY